MTTGFRRPAVPGAVAAAFTLVAIGFLRAHDLSERGQITFLRTTATASAALFSGWFLTADACEPARYRSLTMAAGASHAVHLGAILAYFREAWAPSLEPLTTAVATLGYVAFTALAIGSMPGRHAVRIGWFVWTIFTATYAGNAADRPTTSGVATAIALGVGIARVVVARGQGG